MGLVCEEVRPCIMGEGKAAFPGISGKGRKKGDHGEKKTLLPMTWRKTKKLNSFLQREERREPAGGGKQTP